ncbi:hypothetical protein [Dactylosporangium sp. NPDC051541]|uniref:hypothetical protein n=1 Tax=Dactylosporangium sp. NPDC051541 TaxID=3363977 RepID=UPI0037BE022F
MTADNLDNPAPAVVIVHRLGEYLLDLYVLADRVTGRPGASEVLDDLASDLEDRLAPVLDRLGLVQRMIPAGAACVQAWSELQLGLANLYWDATQLLRCPHGVDDVCQASAVLARMFDAAVTCLLWPGGA